MTKRWGAGPFVVGIAISLLAAGCSDHALGRLGRTSDWLEQVKPTAVTSVATTLPPLIDTDLVGWWNLELGGSATEDSATVVARVYERGGSSTRFIQASPFEVAAALPGIRFPSKLPVDVESVTSQLVYAPRSASLSPEEPAVFGLWSTEPYSRSRSVGQRGVLEVHPVGEEPSCARLSDTETVSCTADFVGDLPVWRLVDARGATWVWVEGEFRYELFLRGDDTVAPEMIASTVPLAGLVRNTVTASG